MWYVIAGIVLIMLVIWWLRRRRQQETPLIALVLLLDAPRTIDEADVRAKIGQALDIAFEDGPDAAAFVLAMHTEELALRTFGHPGQTFMVKIPQGAFTLNNIGGPYLQNAEALAGQIKDMRLQRILTTHRAWLSFDLLHAAEGMTEADVYRCIGRVLAAFVADDCLGVYSPSLQRCNEIDDGVTDRLAGGDPLAIFQRSTNAPVIAVEEDDPRILAAVEEARRRWPEFTAAFTHPSPGQQGFTVKARFADGDTVEFMWVEVTAITPATVTGIVGNEPNLLANVKLGDSAILAIDEIVDWLYVDGEEMVGGFSVKVLQEIMGA